MIEATQIRTIAAQAKIDPGIIEKDYMLSKALMALATLDSFKDSLVFKGGTALKKCYFPGWRFSEDLDFTSKTQMKRSDIMAIFEQATSASSSMFGVPLRVIEYSQCPRTRGPIVSAQLKIGYDGPLRKSSGQKNNIRVDIAFDEKIVSKTPERGLFKTYQDDIDTALPLYPLEEIAAEKLRSILQRGKSRDYYDVWVLLKDYKSDFSLQRTREILKQAEVRPQRYPIPHGRKLPRTGAYR
ncbi:MAG: nucleotidyl transferase AbiEii/AbiGii toxin family protein [candidate division Zixibacteria bacterium]|nr:nucleotidyl transferase AbiEii/AbiGii toxin family protein [candidate division Zixibacteria bacterium]